MSIIFMLIAIMVFLILFFIIRGIIKNRGSEKSTQHYPESEQLYLGNLSYQINESHLKEFFAKYGDVQNVRLIKNNRTGRSKGFAFVTFSNVKEAKKALNTNGQDFRGRPMVVRMAKPPRQ